MLLRAFYLSFLLSLLTMAELMMTLFISKVLLFERALASIPAGYQHGLALLQAAFQTSGTYVQPQPAPLACVSNDTPCSLYATETITLPPQAAPAAGTSCSNPGITNCAMNLQADAHIAEGRMGVQLVITIADRYKNPIVTRTKYLTLRTFPVAPYVAVIGERDGTMADRTSDAEGETAGLQRAPGQDDTQIKVTYHNTVTNTDDTARNVWSTQGWSSGNSGSAAWSP
ncbi:MAG: hypothetical protein NVSMB31_11640 [Vulcanimicrobiaceae bacterium]